MTAAAVLTHLLAALAGAVVMYVAMTRPWWPRAAAHLRKVAMTRRNSERRSVSLSLVVLIASALVIALGVQFQLAQRASDSRDARDRIQIRCVNAWGEDFLEAARTARTFSKKLQRAEARLDQAEEGRDKRIDRILLVFVDLRKIPPEATSADIDRTLSEYLIALADVRAARKNLRAVRAEVSETRAENPYPTLNC